jgi:hypothetical protein
MNICDTPEQRPEQHETPREAKKNKMPVHTKSSPSPAVTTDRFSIFFPHIT